MQTIRGAPGAAPEKSPTTARKGPAGGSALPGRMLVALLMGWFLIALSALIHAAAAATLGGGWSSLGAMWLAAIVATSVAVWRARSRVAAWRRMCFLNGLASLGLLAAGAADIVGPDGPSEIIWPSGPVLGFSIASAVLAIAGLLLAALFFAVWYLQARHDAGLNEAA